jgi:thiamine transporter
MKTNTHLRVRALTEGAILVALAFVLSFVKLYQLPNGGSLTPAMFPILFYALRWGLGRGLTAGFVFGLLQLLFDGAYAWGWQSMVLDYLLAFAPLGLAGIFRGKAWGIFPGTVIGCLGRFLVHHISGITIYRIIEPTNIPGIGTFDNPHLYSLAYNGSYMLPNMLLAMLLAGALYVPLKRYFVGQDLK